MKITTLAINQIDSVGRRFFNVIIYTHQLFLMTYLSFRAAIIDQAQGFRTVYSVVSQQIYFTGVQALPLITVLSIAAGSVVIMQSSFQLNFFGGQDMIGTLLVMIIMREIAPLLTALIVIARSGTAVASELGNMKVNNEIKALESMGINPLSYIVFPRLAGGILSVICLAFYFVLTAFVGGYLITKLIHNMPVTFYINSLANAFRATDVILFISKTTFSGIIIFVVSCFQGLAVQKSPNEVPVATTKAVMNSIIYVIAFNLIATTAFYLEDLMKLGVL